MAWSLSGTLNAQETMKTTAQSNPWGLVYAGALTENVPGKVNIRPITYDLGGLKIAANVYTPAGYDPAKSYPTLVVAHPNGGVKEQVAGLYSQRMAERGYICLAFDAAYQGASEGEPRNTDKPANRIEGIHRAADILLQYPGVNPQRVGIQTNDPRITLVADGYPLFVDGRIVGAVGVGGGTEAQDCEIAEHVVRVFEELTE